MAPVVMRGVFLVGVSGVVDHQIGAIDEPQHILIGVARTVLGIGDVGGSLAAILDTVAGRAARMVQRAGADRDAGMRVQFFAGSKIAEFRLRGEDVERHREERRLHHLAQHLLDAGVRLQMPGPEADVAVRLVARREKRHADDVIEMGVAVEQVEMQALAVAHQRIAERPQPRAAVEDQQTVAAAHLDTGGVAAIAHGLRPRARYAAAHAPKPDREIWVAQGGSRLCHRVT